MFLARALPQLAGLAESLTHMAGAAGQSPAGLGWPEPYHNWPGWLEPYSTWLGRPGLPEPCCP